MRHHSNVDVICLGESMAMFVPVGNDTLDRAQTFYRTVGGAESNVASYLAQLKVAAAWASRVGNDANGRFIVAAVEAEGVDVSRVELDDVRPTGVFFKRIDPQNPGVEYYRHGSAAAAMSPRTAEALLRGSPRLIHVSGVTAALSASCYSMLEWVMEPREAKPLISFDVNLRPALWRGRPLHPLRELAAKADIVFSSRDEAEAVWGHTEPSALLDAMPDVDAIVLKDGANGASAITADGVSFVPSLRVEAVEITGAGDAFAAGFIAGVLANAHPEKSLRMGHILAANAMNTVGDVGPLMTRAEIEELAALSLADWRRIEVRAGMYQAAESGR